MPIAGGVIIPQQESSTELAEQLANETGVEVSGIGPGGIALVFETETMDGMTQLTRRIRVRRGVADLQMTYCSWEDLSAPREV